SSRPQRLGSRPSWRNPSGSPGGASPRSCAVATLVLPTSRGGSWNPSQARAAWAHHRPGGCQTARIEVETTDYHTAGEPFRIVEDGVPDIPGATVRERREYASRSDEV